MSTRSITHIHESAEMGGAIVCSFYRHCDGYPDDGGHGTFLANWLQGKSIVNGRGRGFIEGQTFNGAGEMAVHLMYDTYNESGCRSIPTGSDNYGPPEWIYDIYFEDEFIIHCRSAYNEKYVIKSTAKDFVCDATQLIAAWGED